MTQQSHLIVNVQRYAPGPHFELTASIGARNPQAVSWTGYAEDGTLPSEGSRVRDKLVAALSMELLEESRPQSFDGPIEICRVTTFPTTDPDRPGTEIRLRWNGTTPCAILFADENNEILNGGRLGTVSTMVWMMREDLRRLEAERTGASAPQSSSVGIFGWLGQALRRFSPLS